MKKHVKVLLAVILTMVMGTETMVWAGAQSGLYDSPPAETGYWWSGYDEGQTVTMTSTLSVVYGENVELKFVMPSVGIPSGLIPTTYRDVEMELWEADTSTQSTHKIARKYNGEFEYSPQGVYRITSFGLIQTNDEAIESDSVVNLYVKMYMDSVSGDTYSCLQKGLFQYRYLVD